jgi:hypothetical protein
MKTHCGDHEGHRERGQLKHGASHGPRDDAERTSHVEVIVAEAVR